MSARRESAWRGVPRDLAKAFRSVIGSPKYSLPAILSIMLGVGATTAIFAIFGGVVLRPLPFRDEASLVAVFDDLNAPGLEQAPLSAPELDDYAGNRSLASIGAYEQAEGTVTGLGEPRHVILAHTTLNFLETLGVTPIAGRVFASAGASRDGVDVAVVTHRFWMSALGGGQAVGRTLIVDGAARTVVGVLPDDQAFPATADVWTPIRFTQEQATSRGYRFLAAVARIKDGATLDSARREMDVVAQNAAAGGPAVRGALVPLRDQLLGSTKSTAEIMLIAVGLFLLLACTNVASLLLTRASVRNRELAIRAALGAGPLRLLGETLLEATIVAVIGGALGLLLAVFAVQGATRGYADLLAYAQPQIDARVIGFFAVVCLLTVVAVGAAPALRAARVRPMDSLREGSRGSGGRASRRVREGLVAAQVTATVVLLVGAGILTRSVIALTHVDAGFDANNVATARVSLPQDKYGDDGRVLEFQRQVTESLRSLPGVTSVAATSLLPLTDTYEVSIGVDSRQAVLEKVHAEERHVTPPYFTTMGVSLLQGRSVGDEDRPDSEKVAVVNRTFAKTFFDDVNVVGRRFTTGDAAPDGTLLWKRIVGVVEDTRDFGLDADPKPTFFLPFAQAPVTELSVAVRTSGNPEQLLQEIHRRIRAVDTDVPVYALGTMRTALESSYAPRTIVKWLLLAFAAAAMILAVVGLFGVTSYSVSLRSREIGIRRAIGATRPAILKMILTETGAVVGVGVLAGIAGALYATRFLTTMIFGVSPSDPITYGVVSLVVFAASLLAALPPARTAASVAPVVALRVD